MKKLITLLLALIMVLSLAACGKDDTASDIDTGNDITTTESDNVDTAENEAENDIAEGETKLVITGNVDPRVKEKGHSVFFIFLNIDTGDEYSFYLHEYNDYKGTITVKQGNYVTYSAYVTGDYEFLYDVEYKSFEAKGKTVAFNVDVGEPDYNKETTDVEGENNLSGAIDREETNELLEEDGLPTVDWDAVDDEF
ncbi:MAG: hypothetical protein J6J39_03965 [Clostridia bacterium]|nr:hypothetical protein [Clostridia bacterium]